MSLPAEVGSHLSSSGLWLPVCGFPLWLPPSGGRAEEPRKSRVLTILVLMRVRVSMRVRVMRIVVVRVAVIVVVHQLFRDVGE